LFALPVFYALLITTLLLIYPWTRLRSVRITPIRLSHHAMIVSLSLPSKGLSSKVMRIAHNPLLESHAFAAIPNSVTGQTSILLSRAGDFTRNFIDNPPEKVWIQTLAAFGVVKVARLFSPVLLVATGAGIGPCLSLLAGHPTLNCHIIWSVRDPMGTYGVDIVGAVRRVDSKARIVDTRQSGRRNMLDLTLDGLRESRAEGVVVIANREVTEVVVRGCEERKIAAFGPIWDS
jgi:hypothetical protein